MSRFPEVWAKVAASVEAGSSVVDAAGEHGLVVRTVRAWIEKGRRDPDGLYGDFAARVTAALEARKLPPQIRQGLIDEDEMRAIVAAAARRGNVAAMRLYLEQWLRSDDEPGELTEADRILREMDELAQRRMRRG